MIEERLRERLVGAVVLTAVAVIFVPMVFEGRSGNDQAPMARSQAGFTSSILPADHPSRTADVVEVEPAVGPISAHDEPSQDLAPDRGSQVRGLNRNTKRSPKLPEAETLSDRASVDASRAGWVVQLASFSREANAKILRAKLVARGFGAFIEKTTTTRSSMYRVRVGPTSGRQQAQDLRAALQQAVSLQGVVVRYR